MIGKQVLIGSCTLTSRGALLCRGHLPCKIVTRRQAQRGQSRSGWGRRGRCFQLPSFQRAAGLNAEKKNLLVTQAINSKTMQAREEPRLDPFFSWYVAPSCFSFVRGSPDHQNGASSSHIYFSLVGDDGHFATVAWSSSSNLSRYESRIRKKTPPH